ncbi:MAG TPA: DNA-3-methyladenine glycosylase [Vicinamibacterales bacterium]|jgi:DNA-3-methyladenine glycosylase II|nr:DNA-3-methyladenine glycosylase [Vicinamibacterales bacterium]
MAVDYTKAQRLLARRDPVLRDLMRAHGPCGLAARQHADPFKALIRAIVGQQLSAKAAATIFGRFEQLFEAFPTASQVLDVPDDRLRAVGLSSQKLGYLRDLCNRIQAGQLPLDVFDRMDDEAVIETLTQVKGVGRWTAEMFLIFRLQRPDVLPVGDLGIVKAVQRAYKLRKAPSPDRLTRIGEAWRPYRSVACWYLWASLNNDPTKD